MVVLNVIVNDCTPSTIVLGRRGTYNTEEITFDVSYLIENYGDGTAVLAIKRSQDESAYPAVVAQDGSTLTWTVSDTDTAYVGAGECQLMWYVNNGLAKTIIYPVVVMRDILSTAEEAPDGYQTWVDDLIGLGAETLKNAQDAAQSASDAESAKDDAVAAKEAAEEAAETAQEAVVHAPIIQNGYWYIWNDGQYVDTGVRAEGQKGDKGDTGEKGDTGNGIASITKTGTSGLVDTYTVTYTDGTSTTFTVTNGAKGDKGDTGATGNGIQSITKTGTSGNVDTYTITYTNGQTTTFTVTNGAVSSVAGKTGAVVLDSGDIEYDSTETYESGTVGGGLNDLSRQLSDLTDTVSTTQIINSASGAIASFADGANNMPIRKLVANIEPVQNLHGYSNPWPAGGGKNKYNAEAINLIASSGITITVNDGAITFNGTATATAYFTVTDSGLPSGDYSFSFNNPVANDGVHVSFRDSNNSYFNDIKADAVNKTTVFQNREPNSIVFYVVSGTTLTNFVVKPQLESGSTPTAYAPYSNICPISGHTGAEVTQTGKNLIEAVEPFNIGGDGTIIPLPYYDSIVAAVKKDVTYKISVNGVAAPPQTFAYFKDYPASGSVSYDGLRHTDSISTFVAPIDGYIVCRYSTGIVNPQFEIGSVVTEYEAPNVLTIDVTFPSEAGTVYGGTLTINPDRTGTLVVDSQIKSAKEYSWYEFNDSGYAGLRTREPNLINNGSSLNCSHFKPTIKGNLYPGEITSGGWFYNLAVCNPDTFTTSAEFMSYADEQEQAGTPIQIFMALTNPIRISLTESEISGILTTLYGTNNIWSDTGDIEECEYPADTKLYIDNKITQAIANALNS